MPGQTIVQFVDRVAEDATVRLDVCGSIWSLGRDSDLSPPSLERAYAGSLLADGRPVTSAAHGNRLIRLELLLLDDADTNQAAAHVQRLAMEVNRTANILRWQPGTTNPVFFRTLRGEFGKVYWDAVQKRCSVLIPAEPFAYGVKVDLTAPMNANPFFETDLSDWQGQSGALIARSNAFAHEGSWSMRITPPGAVAVIGARTSTLHPVQPNTPYVASAWLYSVAGWSDARACVDWYDATGTFINTGLGSATVLPAAAWTQSTQILVSPANAAFGAARVRMGATPAATDVLYADEISLAPSFAVSPDPAASANGCYMDISGVRGDVETPLMLSLPGTRPGLTSVLATRRRGSPAGVPFVVQAETLTMVFDTSLPGNDSLMSGVGSNYSRTTFATAAGMSTRLLGSVTALAASVDMRGTYRVFLRARHSVAGDVIQVQLQWGPGPTGSRIINDPVSLFGAGAADPTGLHYYDLGLLQMPPGVDPVHDGYSGVELSVEPTIVEVQAQRVSGTGNVDIDHLLLVPADDRLMVVTWPSATSGNSIVVDGTHELVTMMLTSGGVTRIIGGQDAHLAGGFPLVSPDVVNRIYFIRRVASNNIGSDTLTGSTAVTPSYHPRYLYVRPAVES